MRFGLLFLIVLVSCQDKQVVEDLDKINGYWEIYQVKIDDKVVKEFSQNEFLDYFEVADSIGFRKKVKPTIEGSYLTNDVQQDFSVKNTKMHLEIIYEAQWQKNPEKIIHLTDSLLILNDQKSTYFFKKYKPIL